MKLNKLNILWTSLCVLLFLYSCSKEYESINIYVEKSSAYTRPASLLPTEFDKQPNLVIMGDGYTDQDFGSFKQAADNLVRHLFSVPPFNRSPFSRYFNIYHVYLNSPERGIGHGKSKNTAFRCYFPGYPADLIAFDDINTFGMRKAHNPFEVAQEYIPGINLNNTMLVVLVNDTKIGYMTGFRNQEPYGHWISVISVPSDQNEFKRLVLREVGGKNFGRLAQEDGNFYNLDNEIAILIIQMYSLYGFYANIDIINDEKQVRWAHFLTPAYKDKYPHLGVYPGGFGYAQSVYHPDQDNVMLSNGSLRYNEPSQEAIVKRVYQIHGWVWNNSAFTTYFP